METETIVFDVIGTVVDEASVLEDLASVLAPDVAESTGRRWAEAMDRRLREIRGGRAPWRSSEDVRRAALDEVLPGAAQLSPDQLAWLEGAGRRMRLDLSVRDLAGLAEVLTGREGAVVAG